MYLNKQGGSLEVVRKRFPTSRRRRVEKNITELVKCENNNNTLHRYQTTKMILTFLLDLKLINSLMAGLNFSYSEPLLSIQAAGRCGVTITETNTSLFRLFLAPYVIAP